MSSEHVGWLLDVYADRGRGVVVWVVTQDGQRLRLVWDIGVTFYADGEASEVSRLKEYLFKKHIPYLATIKHHLFDGKIPVTAIYTQQGATQRGLFRQLRIRFPNLDYYNADIALPIHFFFETKTFPMALCELEVEGERVIRLKNRDDKWGLKPTFPDLRKLEIEPVTSPLKALPSAVRVTINDQRSETVSTKDEVKFLSKISALIKENDPDVIRTRYGDRWLFPFLFSISETKQIPFNPNRDQRFQPIRVKENQFESYGHLVHRDQQTLLLGRLHLDPQNSLAFNEWDLDGVFETARLSNLPIQNAARRSAGGAFVGMQVTRALERGILIPISKSRREKFKTATELSAADNGGVIFKPIVGMHARVAEIDFFSMYPNIMTNKNISAETVGYEGKATYKTPGIETPINQDEPGIVAEILKPILEKRKMAKEILESGNFADYDSKYLNTAYSFLKGLGWVSYGYQGFSGNRIGSIEAHEAINAISRDVILHAKEAAEDLGFEVLHIYVDSLFVKVGDQEDKLVDLVTEIQRRTGLHADNEGIFDWIVFLPSKQNAKVPVPNSFYGYFGGEKQETKLRGIMFRRGDTPHYIAKVQEAAIHILAREKDFSRMRTHIPELVEFFAQHHEAIASGLVPVGKMLISQTLSRNVEDFKVISSAGTAALQLARDGRNISAGQNVDFLRIRHDPFSLSWHLVDEANPPELDVDWYCDQLLRAADEILQPFGITREVLAPWLKREASYWRPEDFIDRIPVQLPVLDKVTEIRRSWTLPHPVLHTPAAE